MKKTSTSYIPVFILLVLSGCNQEKTKTQGLRLSDMDTTVNPGDDFFQYTNGGWISKTGIPKDQSEWTSFGELTHYRDSIILAALESGNFPNGSIERKATDFYRVGMDSLLAEKAGIEPLKPYLSMINAIKDDASFQEALKESVLTGWPAPINISVFGDNKNRSDNSRKLAYFASSGLGLRDTPYYTKDDEKSKEIRERYKRLLKNLFVLKGDPEPEAKRNAEVFFKMETELAAIRLSREQFYDNYDKTYNPCAVSNLSSFIKMIDWKKFLKDVNINMDTVIIMEPAFYNTFEKVIRSHSWSEIQIYFTGLLLVNQASYLSHAFVQEIRQFGGEKLLWYMPDRDRKKRVLEDTDWIMDKALGKIFVGETFPAALKENATELGEDIRRSLANRIRKLDWMSDSTKEKALAKLQAMSLIIGHPEKWEGLSELNISKRSYCENIMNGYRNYRLNYYGEAGKRRSKKGWSHSSAQSVEFETNILHNEMNIPAALFQPPLYYKDGDAAINYGAMGVMIAHEILKGFDATGGRYDIHGNEVSWWSTRDSISFREKSKTLVDQYNKYEVLPGVFVNGEYTLRENLNDIGALLIAYDAMQEHFQKNGRSQSINGFTPEQRFFISWSTWLREKRTEENIRKLVTDPTPPDDHWPYNPPASLRVNGSLQHVPEFYEAFGIKTENKLYRAEGERVKVW